MRVVWPKWIWVFSGILVSILVGHGVFWGSTNILVKNDLEANLLQIRYIKMSHWSSNWNPYISLPVWQDPLLAYLNPIWAIPVLFLPVQLGVKIAFGISLLLSGVGMYFLARNQKIEWRIAVILAMTWVISGFPVARIMAGHVEKVLSLAFMPLIVFLLLEKRQAKLTGLFIAMTLVSGDIYTFIYSLLIAFVLLRFEVLWWAMVFGSIRLYPIWQIRELIFKPIEPMAGTQNLFSIGYHLFWPVKQFWGGLMSWVPTNFGWWEKAAFIGPLPIMGIGQFIRRNKINYIIWVLILLAMIGWQTKWLELLHVPTRVFGFLGMFILVSAAKVIKNRKLWLINLGLVLGMSFFAYGQRKFPEISLGNPNVPKGSLVAFDQLGMPIHQLAAQDRGLKMLATNYGFMLQNSDAQKWLEFRLGKGCYDGKLPEYIIYSKVEDIGCLNRYYKINKSYGNYIVYEKIIN